ncbi:MAG: DUF4352 domain-containing protein [Chloroflexota bacterium]|nr:DUF4352 domain-containing protein [Chloroflexota bacterium]
MVGVFLALLMLVGLAGSALAQATPEASPSASGSGPMLGDAVVLYDPTGDELAQIAVTQVVDPYEDAESADRGYHWVGVEIVVANTGESDYEPNVYNIQLLDDFGFASTVNFASRDEDAATAQPEFYLEAPLAPGEAASGWLFFMVIDDATVTQVVSAEPYSEGNFTLLADLGGTIAAEGETTVIYDEQANEAGAIAINEIIPDFQDIDTGIDVSRGTTIVALDLTVENTSDADLEANPYGMLIIDEFGYAYSPAFLFRDEASQGEYPDFPSDVVPAGETAEGVVLFELPSDASISYVIYSPSYSQLYILAQPGEGSVVSGEELTPVPVDAEPAGDETPVDGDETPEVAGGEESAECQGVADWVAAVNSTFDAMDDELDFLDGELSETNPEEIRAGADAIGDIREEIEAIETPEIAQDAHDAVVNLLVEFEALFNDVADRLEDGEDAAEIEESLSDPSGPFFDAFNSTYEAVDALTQACPDSGVDDLDI